MVLIQRTELFTNVANFRPNLIFLIGYPQFPCDQNQNLTNPNKVQSETCLEGELNVIKAFKTWDVEYMCCSDSSDLNEVNVHLNSSVGPSKRIGRRCWAC